MGQEPFIEECWEKVPDPFSCRLKMGQEPFIEECWEKVPDPFSCLWEKVPDPFSCLDPRWRFGLVWLRSDRG
jgi:hypothetical protein